MGCGLVAAGEGKTGLVELILGVMGSAENEPFFLSLSDS